MAQEADPNAAVDPADPVKPADPAEPAEPAADPAENLDADALRAELKKTREEAAKHRVAAREARARAKEYEDQNKTEAQKLQERAETAEKALTAANRAALVASVALKKGLTEAQSKRLIGDTKDELEADADELLESFKNDAGGQAPTGGTRERLRPGAVPSAEEEETDPRKLAAKVPRRYGG